MFGYHYLCLQSNLEKLSRNSKEFRELSDDLEKVIQNIPPSDFERKDFLMGKLTQICCSK